MSGGPARHKHDAGLPSAIAISGGIERFGAAVRGEGAQLGQVGGCGGDQTQVGAGRHCERRKEGGTAYGAC